MAVDFASDPLAELTYYQGLAVDGVFVDCPSTAREWKLATGQLTAQPSSWVGAVICGPGKLFLLPGDFMTIRPSISCMSVPVPSPRSICQ